MTVIIKTYDGETKIFSHPYRFEVIRNGNVYSVIIDDTTIEKVKSISMNEKKSHVILGKFRAN